MEKLVRCSIPSGHPLPLPSFHHWPSATLAIHADTPCSPQYGKNPLDYVKAEEMKAALREHGGKHSLFGAVRDGTIEDVEELVKEGADVNQERIGWEAAAPLHIAASEGNQAMVSLLLASKAAVDAEFAVEADDGVVLCTPLMLAQGNDQTEVASLLKAHGARDSAAGGLRTVQERLAILEYRLS